MNRLIIAFKVLFTYSGVPMRMLIVGLVFLVSTPAIATEGSPDATVPTVSEIITILFNICCGILLLIGEVTGMGYELANLVIFVVLLSQTCFFC